MRQEQLKAKKHYSEQPEPEDHPGVATVLAERRAEREERVVGLDETSDAANERILDLLRNLGKIAAA
ncbi:MAG TPA: hypothetical protein VFI84_01160 [Candidatus Saccharimonadales bacterium]|nr:hypothetical protein [Candidatus Saccharimonadales bacterium]